VREADGNILVTAGITLLLNLLIGAGGTVYSNANANLGIGDSTTAAAIGQTDLQAASNKVRQAMDATYPQVWATWSPSARPLVRAQVTSPSKSKAHSTQPRPARCSIGKFPT
jgi:hypothetical protein